MADRTGLTLARRAPHFAVLTNEACSCIEIDPQSLVIGTLFHRHGAPRAIAALSDTERATLSVHGNAALLATWWGGYISVRHDNGATEILRDPSAALPCYRADLGGLKLFASDLTLLEAASGKAMPVAWEALGRILYAAGLPTTETALAGITDLLAGEAVTIDGPSERGATGWSPWDFAEPGDAGGETVAERLQRTVENCVSAWASRYERPLLSLSGGLDSSIVAACLAPARSRATCLTLFTDDPAGDERGFARLVCDAVGLELAEARYDLDAVDLARPLGADLPRPAGRMEAQPYERAHRAVAERIGADAFFTGNGGDNVFGYSQSAAALADRALHEGPGAGAFATLRDVCRQTGAGPLRVTRAAVRLARQPPGYRWRPSPGFLHPDLVASQRDMPFRHPWLEAPPWALPGKAAHIAALIRAQLTLEADRSRLAPVINPLLSQPILEACLAIPSWQWREGGRDRAMARAAFASQLPAAIVDRKVKGTPDPFCGEIVRRKREELRARLLDGQLARHRILDPGAIEEALRPERPTTGEENVRLLELANVEAWLGARSSHRSGGGAASGSGATDQPDKTGEERCVSRT
ncbi:asparagine synthase-related protein [Sphingomonas psychrotolerans]|uniref:asparagine synthase (glutamine-hydrolyzing) n=1 Tax=Sphingomonas psychrotolerans TaxID=1327635 RepID=A0ABU3N837_9SPHN|nr:asparagine synthase-related protein [Sphingomonas psychrotolerans]MDT8760538.1 asparagine synthase-related protein [Sphingomonas psychrotolerans]